MPLGIDCKVYRRTNGDRNNPTWSEVAIISDFTLDPKWDRAEAMTRETRVKRGVSTLLSLETSGKILVRKSDANYAAFVNAFYSQTPLDLLILDASKDVAGAEGVRADFDVTKLTDEQNTGTLRYRDFTIDTALTDNVPQRATTSGDPASVNYDDLPNPAA